jgi:hypothetical protein
VSFFVVVDFPEKATVKNSLGLPGFLTPEEAAIVLARVERDRGDAVEDMITFRIAMQHLRDWKVWEFTLYLMLNNTGVYAFSYFLPVILKDDFGYSTGRSQLLTFPPYAAGAAWIMVCAFVGDHFKIRGPILVFNASLYIIGVSLTGFATEVHARYAGVFLGVMGIIANIPGQWAYAHNNMVGQNKKGLTMALMVMGGAFGGIIAGNVFQSKDAPGYKSGLWICIAFQVWHSFAELRSAADCCTDALLCPCVEELCHLLHPEQAGGSWRDHHRATAGVPIYLLNWRWKKNLILSNLMS